jgi:hypothetical protein
MAERAPAAPDCIEGRLFLEMPVRLQPPVSFEEAYRYLSQNAVLVWGVTDAARMNPQLQSIAHAMATVSAIDVPAEVEPLFGENIDIDLELGA